MSLNTLLSDDNAYQALDVNQIHLADDGYLVRSGTDCPVSINGTGTLGSGNAAISVGEGTVFIDGAQTSIQSTTLDIPNADPDHPRRDVVYIDSSGVVTTEQGTPEEATPSGTRGFNSVRPAPPDLADRYVVVLSEIWVPSGESSISDTELYDRRYTTAFPSEATADVENGSLIRFTVGETEPAAPANGSVVWFDTATPAIKAIDSTGTLTYIA